MNSPIINRPDLQTFQQKYGQSLITVLFWVLFFFFMRPLLGMVGWFFGLQLFTEIMLVKGGYHSLLELLGWYFVIIIVMSVVVKCWSLYNLIRYGRHEKRLRQPTPVTVENQARHFEVDPGLLEQWQAARRITLEHDDSGRLIQGRT
jgi:poly-beta-1,6-N-acetyl-D-glucosamine biosynthesis protein PgaD